jgi:hypothetical protein
MPSLPVNVPCSFSKVLEYEGIQAFNQKKKNLEEKIWESKGHEFPEKGHEEDVMVPGNLVADGLSKCFLTPMYVINFC